MSVEQDAHFLIPLEEGGSQFKFAPEHSGLAPLRRFPDRNQFDDRLFTPRDDDFFSPLGSFDKT